MADALVAVSAGLQRQLRLLPGLGRKRVECIHNPIISAGFAEKLTAPVDVPPAVRTDLPWIVATGRLHAQKDYPTLLRAFAAIRSQSPAQLLILGEGDERAALEALARTLGIADDTHFFGYVENPLPIMARAQVFALTSTQEGFGNVLVEALAAGAPVVATDCPHGPRDILRHGEFGALTCIGDVAGNAAALCKQIHAPKRPISQALMKHLESFQVRSIGNRYLDVLGIRASREPPDTSAVAAPGMRHA
jgi:glycosyltransferase involved in cell wall biosynthesis